MNQQKASAVAVSSSAGDSARNGNKSKEKKKTNKTRKSRDSRMSNKVKNKQSIDQNGHKESV